MKEAVATSPFLSRLHPHPESLDLYFPEPGQSPAPAELIVDPDIAERMPWLLEPLPPGKDAWSFAVWLEEAEGAVVVRHQPGRIGTLGAKDSEAYLPHVRAARAQDKVMAAMANPRITASGSFHATIRPGSFCDIR
jgi:hypothetical protein